MQQPMTLKTYNLSNKMAILKYNFNKSFNMANWLDIEGLEGYQVSDKGEIRSFKTASGKPKTLSQYKEKNGYMRVHISNNGVPKHLSVHREVAKAFLSKPSFKDMINHKDGDKTNNDVWNLEWCTQSENLIHAYKNGLREYDKKGEMHHNSKLTETDVIEIKKEIKLGERYQYEIANDYNVDPSVISDIKRGKLWPHVTINH